MEIVVVFFYVRGWPGCKAEGVMTMGGWKFRNGRGNVKRVLREVKGMFEAMMRIHLSKIVGIKLI